MAGAWPDMAADQDVPLQADHHQPGQYDDDNDDDADDSVDDEDDDDHYQDVRLQANQRQPNHH